MGKRKIGIFFGQGKYKEQDIKDLKDRIVEITPEVEKEYIEEVKIFKGIQKDYVERHIPIRLELVWEK